MEKIDKKIKEMLISQHKVNSIICKDEKWFRDDVCNKRITFWDYDIIIEFGEMLSSMAVEHWLDKDYDIDNIQLEIVDIWHFFLSKWIRLDNKLLKQDIKVREPINYKGDLTLVLMDILSTDWNYGLLAMLYLTDFYFDSFDEMYKMYITKNALNIFRNQNGYNDNSYNKIWDGKEDNYYLPKIIKVFEENNVELTVDNILKELDKLYSKYKS
jgi:hypothetical protein